MFRTALHDGAGRARGRIAVSLTVAAIAGWLLFSPYALAQDATPDAVPDAVPDAEDGATES